MTTKTPDYKTLTTELEEILAKLQSTDLDVDQATAAYERGMAVARQLEQYLKQAENKVTKLKNSLKT